MRKNNTYHFDDLIEIIKKLRSSCPWDKEQTHASLLKYLLEETVEVVEAVHEGNKANLCQELGDVLLQVVFHAQIASEEGYFTMQDVVQTVTEKMIRRHPHIFGHTKVDTAQEVLLQWEKIKKTEKTNEPFASSALDKVPKSLSALPRAQKLQDQAAKIGFDWPSVQAAAEKIQEELAELQAESSKTQGRCEEELADVLLAVVALGRKLKLDAELALIRGNAKFEKRFHAMEALAGGSENLIRLSAQDLLDLWKKTKIP